MRFSSTITQPLMGHPVKNYELKDHLQNVRVVISDAKLIVDSDASNTVSSADNFVPEVRSAMSFYPFGMKMPGTEFYSGAKPRYDFNGKETDQETGTQDYGMRIYDTRIGKFLSVDPLQKDFPWWSPYHFAGNTPIQAIDLDGLEILNYKTPYRLTLGKTKLNAPTANYSYSDNNIEAYAMVQTAAALSVGYGEIPMSIRITPIEQNPGAEQGQAYFQLTDKEQDAADRFEINYNPGMADAEAESMNGSAAPRASKNERYIRTNTNKNIQDRANALAWGAEQIGRVIFAFSPLKASIKAKSDLNNIVDAYRMATKFVDKSWDFSDLQKEYNWTEGQVNQYRMDIINYVADGKLPINQSEWYTNAVENLGKTVIENFKDEGANARRELESK